MKCARCGDHINPDDPNVEYFEEHDFYMHTECLVNAKELGFCQEEKNILATVLDNYADQELYSEMLGISREELLELIRKMTK